MIKIEQKIINFLSQYPNREFYGQEIAKKVKCSKASASGILRLLAKKKIVFKKNKGNLNFYRINETHPEVKQFKINLSLERLKPLLPKLKKFSQKIILFGSASRGEQTFDSDIDLLIVTNNKPAAVSAFKRSGGRLSVRLIIKTTNEWSELEIRQPEFYKEIKNGIILHNYVSRI